MKSSSLLLFLLWFSCLSLAAQEQPAPALPPAGVNRPAAVPANFVITPFGYFHPSCVLQLKKGESMKSGGLLHHADGSETQVNACQYPHFSPSGAPASSAGDAHDVTAVRAQEPAAEPAVGHGYIENASATTATSFGKQVTTWKVPAVPLMHDGQTIFFYPGFEDLGDAQTSILQPVIGSYDGGQWSMASWNCCLAGTADESTPVAINPGDTIVGTTEMTCAAGTTVCATWNVITQDQTINQSTELTATPSDGQTFNWAFGGMLEVYNLDQCLDYPPDASITLTSQLYDNSMNLIASPNWGLGNPSSTVQPQCDYSVTATATQTTLNYGTTAPSFGLGVSPAVGIAVNQGSSASGTVTITDINGFTGSVQASISNPPTGVTAQLAQGSTSNTYTLTLNATSAAALTGSNTPAVITLTATSSGVSTQTFPVEVIVNPPLTGGIGTAANLTGAYNAYAFFNDSVGYPMLNVTNSLDAAGDVYSANQLNPPGLSPMALNLNGVLFNFGTPNQANAIYGTGNNPITLPNVQSNALQMLGTAVNGSQTSQTILVTYTDNTTQTFTQTFDDWTTGPCTSSNVCTPGESVAVTMPYNDDEFVYPRNDGIFYLYGYSFAVNSGKTLKSVTLPNNRNVVVLAVTPVNIAATPTFSPTAGTVTAPQSVSIADATAGATIYYTTDGTTPSTSSTVYNSAITVSSTQTIEAFAAVSGYISSAVATATYTFPPPNFSITGTAVTLTPGATTGNTSTISLTPSGGFTGVISLSCAITPAAASDPATCSIPASVTISGSSAQTAVLTVNTTAASSALNQPGKLFWRSMGGTALACILLAGVPARRRRGWNLFGILVLSFSLVGGALGCSGGSNGGGGGGGGEVNPGTTPSTYVVTVTGTSGSITQKATVSLTVQ